jgi:hypothetical protein
MKIQSKPFSFVDSLRTRRRFPVAFCWLCAMLLVMAMESNAQQITTTGSSGLVFGTMFKASTKSIAYSSADAARFVVSGKKRQPVRITVSKSNLFDSWQSVFMNLTITNSDCAFSVDDGVTWTTFSTGSLYQDTEFPNGPNWDSRVYVRVGGSLTSALYQNRGSYTGTITVTGEYR